MEYWRLIPNTNYEVNKDGVFRDFTTKEILKITRTTVGYPYFCCNNNLFRCHIIIAKAFPEICGEWFEGCHVHHKDHNKWNFKADNLIVLTPKEHAAEHSKDKKQRMYYAYDTDWNFVESFVNSDIAAAFCLGHKTGITNAINKKTYYYKGYNWLRD